MRYYKIVITNPTTGQVFQTGKGLGFTMGTGGFTFASTLDGTPTGAPDPNALQIEFDVPVAEMHQPQGQFYLRVWGIGLPMIGQAAQLAGMELAIYAGMSPGLPLANSRQAGPIIAATIFQSYGNWQGVNQTLDIIFYHDQLIPANGVYWNWLAGQSIQDALTSCLSISFPKYKIDTTQITATLVQKQPAVGTSYTMATFAQYLQGVTKLLGQATTGKTTYRGVTLRIETAAVSTIYAYDGYGSSVIPLAFQDLIGQPTWVAPNTINFKTVLRSDISLGNEVKFPAGIQAPFAITAIATLPGAGSAVSDKSAFQGTFNVNRVQHFANFRQTDADGWNTTFDAVYTPNSNAGPTAGFS